jgi:hypothetical protein
MPSSVSVVSLFAFAAFFLIFSPHTLAQVSPAGPTAVAPVAEGGKKSDSDLRSEVEQLKRVVLEQQARIEALERERRQSGPPLSAESPAMDRAAPADPAPPVVLLNANLLPSTTADPQQPHSGSSDERVRNLERRMKGLGPISFSGDVRLRGEPSFGGPEDGSLQRIRGRVRGRFNAFADLGEQFHTGISLASGDIKDPTSTNQTLTAFYSRKEFSLDQAFVEYTPKQLRVLTLTGGKFRYPWYNTELTWDKDLNPEGAAESLAFQLKSPALKRVAMIAFQLPFAEVAGRAANYKRIVQNAAYGGQLQTNWDLGSRVKLAVYSGFYDFQGADSIALALARASANNPQTPLTGLLPLASSNPVQNSTVTTTSSTVITIGGKAFPSGVSTIANSQFASGFGLFDTIGRVDIDSGQPRWPAALIGDYVQNTQACANLPNLAPVPANTTTQIFTQTVNSPCHPNQRRGYWAEARFGRLQEKGDLQFGYTRIYVEREAVLGNFNYSEMRQGTNVTQHRFDAFYQFERSVQLGSTALVGRPLATTEPWFTRLQFDVTYIF